MGTNLFDIIPAHLLRPDALVPYIAWLNAQAINHRTRQNHLRAWAMYTKTPLSATDYAALAPDPIKLPEAKTP